jgi:NAD(P)H dehydrogenase (quinone)
MANKNIILVTGASGHLGTEVIDNLLKKTSVDQVAALVRDETKASALIAKEIDIRVGDYDNSDSLDQAMVGIDKVLLISGTDEEKRLQQHSNVIDAAQRAKVRCLAYTSRNLKDRKTLANKLMNGHFQTEDYLKSSGLNYLIFRNSLYMDTVPQFVGEKVFETGINLPTGEGKVAFALRAEIGEAIANALLENDCKNKIYKLTGSESYSFDDVANCLTELSARKIDYKALEKSAFEARLKERGLPEVMIERIAGFLIDIKNGQEEEIRPDLENLLGRKPASLKQGVKILFNL